jgi:hypothetical protein
MFADRSAEAAIGLFPWFYADEIGL